MRIRIELDVIDESDIDPESTVMVDDNDPSGLSGDGYNEVMETLGGIGENITIVKVAS